MMILFHIKSSTDFTLPIGPVIYRPFGRVILFGCSLDSRWLIFKIRFTYDLYPLESGELFVVKHILEV